MKRLVLLLILVSGITYGHAWEPLSGHVRYNDACFLTAHNAYASVAHGYSYAQQRLSIAQQLEIGVRGFMLDTRIVGDSVRLCHKNAFITRLISRGKEPMHLHEALITMKEFLDKNPTEIISVFLETYVSHEPHVVDEPFIQAGLAQYMLTPDCHKGWPTLEWMRKENKRFVVFNTQCQTRLCFNAWQHVVENQWGTLHPVKAAKERPESRKWHAHDRHLYLLNYFPMFNLSSDGSYNHINTQGVDTFMERILKTGLSQGSNKDLLPTFICMDYIDIGNGMKHVMHINNLRLQQYTQSTAHRL